MRILYDAPASEEALASFVLERIPTDFMVSFPEAALLDSLLVALADREVLIATRTIVTRQVVEAAPALRLVVHQGVGYQDTVDLAALRERGVRLAVTPSGTVDTVAEHTVMLMFAVLRHLTSIDREMRGGGYPRYQFRLRSFDLQGKRIGYVGMGRIAQAVVRRLAPFGTRPAYTSRRRLPEAEERALGLDWLSFDELVETADIVSLHAPGGDASRHMFDRATLARMRPGAILVNTARGSLVDEDALADALRSGHLLGAGLDAFETEPLPADSPLRALDNVVLTPHSAAGTADALSGKLRAIVANLYALRDGRPLSNEIMLAG